MFEKISNAAEKLATNVSESRRGFFARVGRIALGVAGVVGGLLAVPTQAHATTRNGYCQALRSGNGLVRLTGVCVASDCTTRYLPSQCRGYGSAPGYICQNKLIAFSRNCSF
jgi:hypothetical protein